jgi:hypothetical protein
VPNLERFRPSVVPIRMEDMFPDHPTFRRDPAYARRMAGRRTNLALMSGTVAADRFGGCGKPLSAQGRRLLKPGGRNRPRRYPSQEKIARSLGEGGFVATRLDSAEAL